MATFPPRQNFQPTYVKWLIGFVFVLTFIVTFLIGLRDKTITKVEAVVAASPAIAISAPEARSIQASQTAAIDAARIAEEAAKKNSQLQN